MSYAIPLVIRVSIEFLHYKLKLTKLIWQIIYSAERKKKANQIKAEISYINIYMCVYNIYLYTMLLWSTYMYLRKKNQ
jgi:Zn-dependent peptidase ImmA (M78 family)